jgi:TonB-dependent SusC/RagA subfamily outer membrane receptor
MAFAERVYVEQDPQRDNKSGTNSGSESVTKKINSLTNSTPLYIVDGKEDQNLDDIQPEDIESISILKDGSASLQYGEKGRNGVVIITLKKNAMQEAEVEQQQTAQTANQSHFASNNSTSVQSLSLNGNKPLYFIDGKEVQNIENINPEYIESISVLKDEAATTIYGERGYNGVILITTKEASRKN